MPGRRNPLKLDPFKIELPRRRQRPDAIPNDDDLRLILLYWKAGLKVRSDMQHALNFRLADLLAEKRVRLSPLQQAVVDVAKLISGRLGPGWTEYQACKEVARVRGVSEESLKRTWRLKKKQAAKPRTKSP
jgi:hypothetical protein